MSNALLRIVVDWGIRAFGHEHMHDPKVRALRLAEEAIECAQAVGVPEAQLGLLVEVVYSRPVNSDVGQEIGGIQVCTGALCNALGLDPDETLEREVRRVLSKSPEHFARRNKEKLQLGLTGEEAVA